MFGLLNALNWLRRLTQTIQYPHKDLNKYTLQSDSETEEQSFISQTIMYPD